MKIKTGDSVKILTGKDKGKTGKVILSLPDKEKIVIENINVYKKHTKASAQHPDGGIVDKEMPIHVSNVKKV